MCLFFNKYEQKIEEKEFWVVEIYQICYYFFVATTSLRTMNDLCTFYMGIPYGMSFGLRTSSDKV